MAFCNERSPTGIDCNNPDNHGSYHSWEGLCTGAPHQSWCQFEKLSGLEGLPEPGDLVLDHSGAPVVWLDWKPTIEGWMAGEFAYHENGRMVKGMTEDVSRTFKVISRYRDTVPITDF